MEGNEAVLSVTDTGVGIGAEALAKVFEMFAQVPSSAAKPQGGLGIGLSLVQSLVALHGGSVSAASPGPARAAPSPCGCRWRPARSPGRSATRPTRRASRASCR
jgi:signal transduction histidine kinase